jgi:hypothetical protein
MSAVTLSRTKKQKCAASWRGSSTPLKTGLIAIRQSVRYGLNGDAEVARHMEPSMPSDKNPGAPPAPTRRQLIFFSWTKDVLIYVVVLNLFVEYVEKVVIDSFTISILTAILLKVLLEVILGLEHRVAHFFEERPGNLAKFLRVMSAWLILFLSKFVILEVVDLVFGDHVELGSFVQVLGLVLVLMIAREVVQRLYVALGSSESLPIESAGTLSRDQHPGG